MKKYIDPQEAAVTTGGFRRQWPSSSFKKSLFGFQKRQSRQVAFMAQVGSGVLPPLSVVPDRIHARPTGSQTSEGGMSPRRAAAHTQFALS